ncbi:hypothetical protein BVF91_11585 [Thermoanaerobacterium sp. PSU-2]|uniref:hypothetical protein n=1 Tax=Thermoanaerobacterium sp. PSU-2 TaxID=1930849 RepID=UPI000A14DD36|nr:hypothetical protein [Thermoanaerobacterium sp. PSU-2]ORX22475.1 hypothetical protein BVF91_11585 [Thermoanaerobacterium sp. PSU-2]
MSLFGSKDEKTKMSEKYGKRIMAAMSKYVGGNLSLSPNEDIEIICYEKGIALHPAKYFLNYENDEFITYDRLQPTSFKTEEQISKDVTLTRLLLVGIFAFGLKKKRVTHEQYLIINYDKESNGIFQIPKLYINIVAKINEARSKYLSSFSG